MTFIYNWKNKEANFGKPLEKQVKGGTHITCEIILKHQGKYIALRRASIPGHEAPSRKKILYFCHNLIRYGESIDQCVKRIVKSQTGVSIKSCKVVYIDSNIQKKDKQWAITPHIIAELNKKPKTGYFGNQITEVVKFTKNKIPKDFAFWPVSELKNFLQEFDS